MLLFQFGILAIYVAVGLAYEDAGPITSKAKIRSNESKCYGKMCQISQNKNETHDSVGYEEQPDVFFDIGNLSIYAKFDKLAASIPFFAVPYESFDDKIKELLDQDFDPSAVNSIFEFVYTGIIKIDHYNVRPILRVAKYLQIEHVVSACFEYLTSRLEDQNVIDLLRNPAYKGVTDLRNTGYTYIQDNFSKFSQTSEFLDLSASELLTILRSNEIRNTSEEHVFEAVMKWIRHKPYERRAYRYQILEHVRMPLLSYSYLAQYVMPQFINNSIIQVRRLIKDAMNYHVFPEYRTNEGCNTWPRDGTSKFLNLQKNVPMHTYDPVTLQLSNIPPSAVHIDKYSSFIVHNCLVYMIGGKSGNSVKVYNPSNNSWGNSKPMIEKRSAAGVAAVNGVIYACGGLDENNVLKSTESYNVHTKTWTQLASMSVNRQFHQLIAVDNYLYAIGGYKPDLNSVEKYDISLDVWTTMEPMSTVRSAFGAAVFDEKIYVCGGHSAHNEEFVNSAEVYDTKKDTWSPIAKMIVATRTSLQAYKGVFWAFSTRTIQVYNPDTDIWTLKLNRSNDVKDVDNLLVNF